MYNLDQFLRRHVFDGFKEVIKLGIPPHFHVGRYWETHKK